MVLIVKVRLTTGHDFHSVKQVLDWLGLNYCRSGGNFWPNKANWSSQQLFLKFCLLSCAVWKHEFGYPALKKLWINFPYKSLHDFFFWCWKTKRVSDPDRKSNYETRQYQEVCDNSLPEGWYCFGEASGTKMPTTRMPTYRCGIN